jgi:hypothetical protein
MRCALVTLPTLDILSATFLMLLRLTYLLKQPPQSVCILERHRIIFIIQSALHEYQFGAVRLQPSVPSPRPVDTANNSAFSIPVHVAVILDRR